jgi:hypothetical protein
MIRCSSWAVVVLVLGSVSAAVAAPPTMDEINAAYEQKDYKKCVQLCGVVVQLSGAARQAYDLSAVWSKIGECGLQQNQRETALNGFKRAAEYAASTDAKAMAIAESKVVGKSAMVGGVLTYTSSTGQKIDLRDPALRQEAMKDLARVTLPPLQQKARAALDSKSLVPTMKLLPELRDAVMLDLGANGKLEESGRLIASLSDHARGLMTAATRRMSLRVDEIKDLNQWGVVLDAGSMKRSLDPNHERELKQIRAEMQEIEKVATRARQRADEFGGKVEAWDAIVAAAAELNDKVDVIFGV